MSSLRNLAVDLLPGYAVRIASAPYVAGDSLAAAMDTVRRLLQRGISSTIDVLGEDTTSRTEIDAYLRLYHRLVDTVAAEYHNGGVTPRRRPSVSFKPSSFAMRPPEAEEAPDLTDFDLVSCRTAITELVEHAAAADVAVTIDMEDHRWTDFTLDLYQELFDLHGRAVGTVLQAMLRRTEDDIAALPDGCRIRFCIGIYDEPADIAHRSRDTMKREMLRLVPRLFDKEVYVEWGTHEEWLIDRFIREVVVPRGLSAADFETQMLLGVPRDRLIERLVTGELYYSSGGESAGTEQQMFVHRLYIPFTENWEHAVAYSRRRLKGSPSLFWAGLRAAPRVMYSYLRKR